MLSLSPVYWCPKCYKWFRKNNLNCLVLHPEGQCCHYGDTKVEMVEITNNG